MSDKPPLLFRRELGGLRPCNPAAEKALSALEIGSPVRIEIKKSRGNHGRLALYWIVLSKAAPVLSDMCEGDALDEAWAKVIRVMNASVDELEGFRYILARRRSSLDPDTAAALTPFGQGQGVGSEGYAPASVNVRAMCHMAQA